MPEVLCFDPPSQRGDPSMALNQSQVAAVADLVLSGWAQPTVKNYGAKCDLVCLQNISVMAGSDILNSTDAAFTTADVGKIIGVTGAGASIGTSVADGATLYGPHVSTIAQVITANQVRMAEVASRTVATASGTGIQYVYNNATAEGGAKAFYGSDDTAAIQAAVDALHPLDGIIRIPSPGCLVNGTIYCQRVKDTAYSTSPLLWRRLEFRGVGPTAQGSLTGAANPNDSNLFKPTAGPILAVNLDSSGAGMTSVGATPYHQFYNFNVDGIAFHGLPGVATVGMNLHRVRASIYDATFNNLSIGWDGQSADVNGSPNYCDQWTTRRVKFNNCAQMFKQRDTDACDWLNLYAESHYPTIVNAIEIFSGRGWRITAPLINNLPRSAKIGTFTGSKGGLVTAGHFEGIWGTGFSVVGSNGNTWVDVEHSDWFNSVGSAAITANTIEYSAAGGRVQGCGFSHNRASGEDIRFNGSRHQEEKNNHFYEADNTTRRFPSVNIVVAGGNIATSFHQTYFINVVCYDGTHFDLRNVNGASILSAVFTSAPSFDTGTGRLNLDGSAKWGRPNKAIAVQKAGKYRPVLVGVYILSVEFYNDAGTKVMATDTNMDFWLEIA